jgi:hypothetical protein
MSRIVEMYSNDDSIIEGIKKFDDDAVTRLYMKHKDYCLRFMNSKYDDEHSTQDIYQDAVIVFIENSICYNQIKVRFNNTRKPVLVGDDFENHNNYNENINDWFNDVNDINTERMKIVQEELQSMKDKGQQCFELLKKFFFEKCTMEKIAESMNYTNAANAKAQKWKCQERLKKQVLNRLQQC